MFQKNNVINRVNLNLLFLKFAKNNFYAVATRFLVCCHDWTCGKCAPPGFGF